MRGFLPFTYPGLLYNDGDIDHGANTITNRGTSGGTLTMNGFTRNNGAVSGGVTIANNAMVFDGVNGTYIQPGIISGLDSRSSGQTFFYKGISIDSIGQFEGMGSYTNSGGTDSRLNIMIRDDRRAYVELSATTAGMRFYSTTLLNAGQLYDIAIVVNDSFNHAGSAGIGDITIYIDGVEETVTTQVIGGNSTYYSYLMFGAFRSNNFSFDGNIGVFRLFNKALSASEITAETASGTYSTITDGSLVGQRTGRDYAGTASVPTTIYDTNMVVNTDTSDVNVTGIVFDGVDDKLVFSPALTDTKTDTKSISGTFKLNADAVNTASSFIITCLKYMYVQIRTTTNAILIRYDKSGAYVSPYYYLGAGNRERHNFVGQVINNGDGTYTTNMFINGTLVGTATHAVGPDFDYTYDEGIGLPNFKGVISNIQVYNKALTAGEIQRLNVGIGPK